MHSTDVFVKLLRNVNGERFEEMNVFEPLPFDVEVNRHGLWEESGAGEDPGNRRSYRERVFPGSAYHESQTFESWFRGLFRYGQ